jgi:predicted nuclease of predicted toxin-antitoxin system
VRFLIDECCGRAVADVLRDAGHDIKIAQSLFESASDEDLAAFAISEDRIVVSEDFDFGELAVRRGIAIPGVILVSFSAPRIVEKAIRLAWLVETEADGLLDHITILYADDVRRRRLR